MLFFYQGYVSVYMLGGLCGIFCLNVCYVDEYNSGFFDNQILDVDREGLTKLKKAVKAMHASGNGKHFFFFGSLDVFT